MKKQNILELLCNDYQKRLAIEKENLASIIKEEEYVNLYHHINIFLTNNCKLYNLDFDYDITATNEVSKAKSLYLLNVSIIYTMDLIGTSPNFFKHYEKEFNRSCAFDEIVFRVLLGNILEIKKELQTIKPKNAKEYIESYSKLSKILRENEYTPF